MKKKTKEKKTVKKKSWFFMFFTKYTIWGLLLISISVIADLCNCKDYFIVDIISHIISTIGVALLVGAIFDFSKNSEAFTSFVSNILRGIVVSKDFFKCNE